MGDGDERGRADDGRSDALRRVWSELGGDPSALSAVVDPSPVALDARLPVADLAWASVAAASLAAAEVAAFDGSSRAVTLDPQRVAVAYTSERHLLVDGEAPDVWASLSGFFPTSDGWVRTHANYPHHARALRAALASGDDPAAVRAALARSTAADAATRVTAAGGLCVEVAREDGDAVDRWRSTPLVHVGRLGGAPPRALPGGPADAPLRGVRVLDLTRVIAGPVCTRTLALLGADVLRIDPAHLAEPEFQHLDTGHGKRTARLDIAADPRAFDALLATADVVVLGYRPAALDRLGLSPAALARRRPGVVVARLSAWGADAPERRGFDSLVQAASGIAWIQSADGITPAALPAQALDHSAGYLLAAAVCLLLKRRTHEGGSWLAETSLDRIAAELLGMPRRLGPALPLNPSGHLQSFDIDGLAVMTAAPAIAYRGGPDRFVAPHRWASDAPEWSPAE